MRSVNFLTSVKKILESKSSISAIKSLAAVSFSTHFSISSAFVDDFFSFYYDFVLPSIFIYLSICLSSYLFLLFIYLSANLFIYLLISSQIFEILGSSNSVDDVISVISRPRNEMNENMDIIEFSEQEMEILKYTDFSLLTADFENSQSVSE